MPHKLTKIILQSEINGIVVTYNFNYYEGGHDMRVMTSRSEGPYFSLGVRNGTSLLFRIEEETLRRGYHELVVTTFNQALPPQVNRTVLGYPFGYEYRVRQRQTFICNIYCLITFCHFISGN